MRSTQQAACRARLRRMLWDEGNLAAQFRRLRTPACKVHPPHAPTFAFGNRYQRVAICGAYRASARSARSCDDTTAPLGVSIATAGRSSTDAYSARACESRAVR